MGTLGCRGRSLAVARGHTTGRYAAQQHTPKMENSSDRTRCCCHARPAQTRALGPSRNNHFASLNPTEVISVSYKHTLRPRPARPPEAAAPPQPSSHHVIINPTPRTAPRPAQRSTAQFTWATHCAGCKAAAASCPCPSDDPASDRDHWESGCAPEGGPAGQPPRGALAKGQSGPTGRSWPLQGVGWGVRQCVGRERHVGERGFPFSALTGDVQVATRQLALMFFFVAFK